MYQDDVLIYNMRHLAKIIIHMGCTKQNHVTILAMYAKFTIINSVLFLVPLS